MYTRWNNSQKNIWKKKKIWRKIKEFVKWIQENLKIVKILMINRCNTQDGIIVKKIFEKEKKFYNEN